MSARADVTGVFDRGTARKLEVAVIACFAGRSDVDEWTVSITSPDLTFYRVMVQRLGLKREKLFFQSAHIVDDITEWVRQYLPPRDPKQGRGMLSAPWFLGRNSN